MPVPAQRPLYLLLLLLSAGGGGFSSPLDLEPPAPEAAAPVEADPTQATPLPDPCEGRPCLNGGACSAQPSDPETEDTLPNTWAYSCTCTSGFTGRNCEVSPTHLPVLVCLSVCLILSCWALLHFEC